MSRLRPIDDDVSRVEARRRRLTHDDDQLFVETTLPICDYSATCTMETDPCFGYLWKELLCRTFINQHESTRRSQQSIASATKWTPSLADLSIRERGRRILERGSTCSSTTDWSSLSLFSGDGNLWRDESDSLDSTPCWNQNAKKARPDQGEN